MSEFAKQVLPVALESEMRESYLAYAMSVIVEERCPMFAMVSSQFIVASCSR